MADINTEKEKLTDTLSDQYSKNIISLEEYEKMLGLVNNIETARDLTVTQKAVSAYSDLMTPSNNYVESKSQEHKTVFSWRSTTIKSMNGNAGKFTCVFGTNQIIINDLPKGKTVLNVEAVFGLIEIMVPKKVKVIIDVVPVFSGIFIPPETDQSTEYEDRPELHITGKAVFGNITIMRNG